MFVTENNVIDYFNIMTRKAILFIFFNLLSCLEMYVVGLAPTVSIVIVVWPVISSAYYALAPLTGEIW